MRQFLCTIFLAAIALSAMGHMRLAHSKTMTTGGSAYLFFDEVTPASIGKTLEDIVVNKRNVIILNSDGGMVESAMAFYDVVRHGMKREITVVGVGQISSAAVILFCSGNKRLIGRNAYMLFHNISMQYKNTKPTERNKQEDKDRILILENLYAKIVSETTRGKISPEQVHQMMDKSTLLTASEALNMGIATGYLEGPIF
ncbi:ATP-dependent Clp protease proteolytic subunit [Solidesulfovibrio sp.]|uniref:ClpP family protease n=1 Tax=Solidesulfovibrio sp. TaxID=2910990 RepID=UPI002606CAD2|nr:ATP-dependent Clp protease proteolytic subunit [Solidesulfovibrio sp.]